MQNIKQILAGMLLVSTAVGHTVGKVDLRFAKPAMCEQSLAQRAKNGAYALLEKVKQHKGKILGAVVVACGAGVYAKKSYDLKKFNDPREKARQLEEWGEFNNHVHYLQRV